MLNGTVGAFVKKAADAKPGKIGPAYGKPGAASRVGSAVKHLTGAITAPLAPILYPLSRLDTAGSAADLNPEAPGRKHQSIVRRAGRAFFNPGTSALHRVVADLHDAGQHEVAKELTHAIKNQPTGQRGWLSVIRRILDTVGLQSGFRRDPARAAGNLAASPLGIGIEQSGSRKHFVRGLREGGKSSIWRRWADPVGASQYDIASSVKKHHPHTAERTLAALHGEKVPGKLRLHLGDVASALKSLASKAKGHLQTAVSAAKAKFSK